MNRTENIAQRFITTDPLKDKYPYYSSYQYAGNKPINNIDLDGLEPNPETDTGGQKQPESETATFDSGNSDFDKTANQVLSQFGADNVSINVTNIDGDVSGEITVGGKTAYYDSENGFFTKGEDGEIQSLGINEDSNLIPSGSAVGAGQILYGIGEDLTLRNDLYVEPYRQDLENYKQNPTQQNKAKAAYNRQNNLGAVREKLSPTGKALSENTKSFQKSVKTTKEIATTNRRLGGSTNKGFDKFIPQRTKIKGLGVAGHALDLYFALERVRESDYNPNVISNEATGFAGAILGGKMGAELGLLAAPFLGPFAPAGPIIGGIAGAALGYYLTSGEATRDIKNVISPGGNNPNLFKF